MPLWVGDYLADTGHLTTVEHGAYVLLIMHYWRRGGLPDDDVKLASIARLPLEQWQSIRTTIQDLFYDGWKHKRVDIELAIAEEKHEVRVNAGKKGGETKASNAKAKLGNAVAKPYQSQSQSQSHKKEEDTRAERAWSFNQFWLRFPNKVGKRAAEKAFDRVRKSGRVDFDVLMAGLEIYVHKTDDRPWCNPATWLNQERWDDQPAANPGRGPPRGQRGFLDVALTIEETHERNHTDGEPLALPAPHARQAGE